LGEPAKAAPHQPPPQQRFAGAPDYVVAVVAGTPRMTHSRHSIEAEDREKDVGKFSGSDWASRALFDPPGRRLK